MVLPLDTINRILDHAKGSRLSRNMIDTLQRASADEDVINGGKPVRLQHYEEVIELRDWCLLHGLDADAAFGE